MLVSRPEILTLILGVLGGVAQSLNHLQSLDLTSLHKNFKKCFILSRSYFTMLI